MIRDTINDRQIGHTGRSNRRRGVAFILSLLYLILFSTLAIGFYATSTTQSQIAANDQRAARALLAAESGLDFIRYHLAHVVVPQSVSADELVPLVYDVLLYQMEQTPNLQGRLLDYDGTNIIVPPIALGDGQSFSAVIGPDAAGSGLALTVTGVEGSADPLSRSIRMDFRPQQRQGSILDFGLASRSVITMDSNARVRGDPDRTRGKILSTSYARPEPVQMRSNAQVSGDIYMVNPEADVDKAMNVSIAGSTNSLVHSDHIHRGVAEPEFPTIDTDPFRQFAGTDAGYGGVTISPTDSVGETRFHSSTGARNILIKANPNPDHWVVFDNNQVIDGVIYIETPNRVRFSSNVTVRGAIVVQNYPTDDYYTNRIVFNSSVSLQSIDTLAGTNNTYFPPAMTALSGSAILAPNFTVAFNSNFGSVGGSIVASRMYFDSNARGTVQGSVINLDDSIVALSGNSDITITGPRTPGIPAGLGFSRYLAPVPDSYEELR